MGGGVASAALVTSLVGGWSSALLWHLLAPADIPIPAAAPASVVTLTPQACHCHCDVNVTRDSGDRASWSSGWPWAIVSILAAEAIAVVVVGFLLSFARRARAQLASVLLGKGARPAIENGESDAAPVAGGKRRGRGTLAHLAVDVANL